MRRLFIAATLMILVCLSLNSSRAGAEGPEILSWSNTKTADRDTFIMVKSGESITFKVEARGAEKFRWEIDTDIRKGPLGPVGSGYRRRSKQYQWRQFKVQEGIQGDSFTWVVPGKGMWKVRVKAMNAAYADRVNGLVRSCAAYWKKDENGRWSQWMRDALCPSKARKEWIISTSLVEVKPGESIAEAIDSLPPAGGVVKLLPGTHTVKKTVTIKRNNLAIVGSRSAIVEHDTKLTARYARGRSHIPGGSTADRCFDVPRGGGYHDITFKGFTVKSTYGGNFCMIFAADEVINFTVEDIENKSTARWLVAVMSDQQNPRYNKNIFIRNNTTSGQSGLSVTYAENVHWIDNRPYFGIDLNRNLGHVFVYSNHVDKDSRRSCCVRGHGAVYAHICNNILIGGLSGVYNDGLSHCIIENNTISGVTMNRCYGGIHICPQSPRIGNIYRNNRIFGCLRGVYTNQYTRSAYNDEYRRKHYPPGYRPKVSNPRIINNVIYNCLADGICMTSPWVRLDISNNIIANNKGYGINYIETKEPTVIRNNNVWRNAKGDYNGCSAGPGDLSKDPLFADPANRDFHLKSKSGRWDAKAKKWVKDNVHSPCIDAGDPKSEYKSEPPPNGGRINMGAYGNTKESSKSRKGREK